MNWCRIPQNPARGLACTLLLAGCAAQPVAPVDETLDPGTGTTTSVLTRPIELEPEEGRGAFGASFAFLAPFETNRMGRRTLYLWVAATQGDTPLVQSEVECDSQRIDAVPISGEPAELGLTRAPYVAPVPWSTQWYFRMPYSALECLANARQVAIVTRDVNGELQRFRAPPKSITGLGEFVAHVAPSGESAAETGLRRHGAVQPAEEISHPR
ncbi:MAG: hypothetical protein DIU56_015625 [Pseudomonadota bacterium]|jgi:hypothetical protein|nr:MAG: hypothetical protein DIU56_16435 [Pseudomonadota bacterium]